jgi:hypothetical protein
LHFLVEHVALFEAADIVGAEHGRENCKKGFRVLLEFQGHGGSG